MAALSASSLAEPASRRLFTLDTQSFSVGYSVGADGILQCAVKTGKDDFPVSGRVLPVEPLAAVYESHTLKHESNNIDHATVVLRDPARPLRVEVHLRAYKNESILEEWLTITNDTQEPFSVKRLDPLFLQSPAGTNAFLEWFYTNGWGQEAKLPSWQQIPIGGFSCSSQEGNRHLAGAEPWFCLGFGALPEEDKGQCLVAALAWSGSTRMDFKPEAGRLTISGGVSQTVPFMIYPGKTMTSPAAIYTFSAVGKGAASRNFHRWMRQYGMKDGARLRPVDNNSWEGCGPDVNEKSIIEMMKLSAELGIELYVMDDGWFGNGETARVDDKHGLGDWQINSKRFPNGLGPVMDASKEYKIGFGIWFEPEMVNPLSELFKKHPEWVMKNPAGELKLERNQAVLDVANPQVQQFMFDAVNAILTAYPAIRFVKWDANSDIRNPYSPYLGADRQGEMPYLYMAGYYGVLAKLAAKFPRTDFQACSAGGGRADLGAMKNSHTFWPSDNTDPNYRLGAIWNYTLCMPPLAATCHVTHAGKGSTKFRFDVAMMGQLGMEIDPRKASSEYREASKVGIAAYKSVRDIVQFGDLYRHQSPFKSKTPSLNFVSADKKRALVLAYHIGEGTSVAINAPVAGLDPKKQYRLAEINLPADDNSPRLQPAAKPKASGETWMKQGIPLVFTHFNDSAAVTLEVSK